MERNNGKYCNEMTAILSPIKPWTENTHNRCGFDEISKYWKACDVITFLADLGMYHPSLYNFLDDREREQEQKFKTGYFKKRFTISRTIIKHLLLNILDTGNVSDIVLDKEKNGRIMVRGRQDLFISLSYSGTCIAVSMGKRKFGSDIEVLRPVEIRKIKSCPLFHNKNYGNRKEEIRDVLHLWTLVEAYAKLHSRNPYIILNYPVLPEDAHFVSYSINHHSILSLAFSSDHTRDTLLWIDPKTVSSAIKNAACSSTIPDGDTYVRA